MHIRITRRRVMSVVLSTTGLLALVAVLHLPVARPLLAQFGVLCPVNNVSASQVERMQGAAFAALRGSDVAPSHEPFGLHLLSVGSTGIDAWTRGRPAGCETTQRGFTYVSCRHVPASALGRYEVDAAHDREVVFTRDRTGRALGVDVLARTQPAAAGAEMAQQLADDLRAQLGEPTSADGEFDGRALDAPFHSASRHYRFHDVIVVLSATNIPGSGLVVREQYMAAPAALQPAD
jgi:hypothetical protein